MLTEESEATLISAVKFLFLTWVATSPTNKSPLFVPLVVIVYKKKNHHNTHKVSDFFITKTKFLNKYRY